MALTQQIKTLVVNAQDEIPTVRPPRASFGVAGPSFTDAASAPVSPSLWQLARQVMMAEAHEALFGARR